MKKTIKDVKLEGKKVLIRVDFNVPMKNGVITNDNRIVQALPTIKYAIDNNAKVVLFSHLGRVKTEEDKANNSLAPVAKRLEELLGQKVKFVAATRGKELEDAVNNMEHHWMDPDKKVKTVVSEMGDSSVNFKLFVWADAVKKVYVVSDVLKCVYDTLDAHGITIPFPQRDVHIIKE